MLQSLADNRVAGSRSFRLRAARMGVLRAVLDAWLAHATPAPAALRLCDIGGTADWWRQHGEALDGLPCPVSVTIVNRTQEPVPPATAGLALACRVGDARDLADLADASIDLVFSNSVIEHVGVFAEQHRMAREVRRIGRNYLIQTPYRWFPIEPHFLVPGWQFMPVDLRVFLHRHFRTGWYGRAGSHLEARANVDEVRLLDRRDLRALFPEAHLLSERVMGLTKSLLVLGGELVDDRPNLLGELALPPPYGR